MNKKKIVSLGIAAVFLALGTTGLLLYLVQHNKPTKVIHTTFGLFFVGFAVFHIINNVVSLTSYMKEKGVFRLTREFMLVFTLATASVIGAGLMWPPFEMIEEFGEGLRKGGQKSVPKISFSKISTGTEGEGERITIMIEKDRAALIPVIGIWTEDSVGTRVEDLFIPSSMLQVFEGEKGNEEHAIREGEVNQIPVGDGVLPSRQSKGALASNFDGPTPNENLMIESFTKAPMPFTIKVEVHSLGKTEIYSAVVKDGNTMVKLQPEGEGKMLKVFAGLAN